jgi:hypothetical protein
MGFVASLQNLQKNHVFDPSNVLGPMMEALKKHANDLKEYFEKSEPADPIELPSGISPTTRDNGVVYVPDDPGPYAPPNPLSPNQRPKYFKASAESNDGVGKGPGVQSVGMYPRLSSHIVSSDLAVNNLQNRPEPPMQVGPPPGIYSGKPMRQWIVPPLIWGRR